MQSSSMPLPMGSLTMPSGTPVSQHAFLVSSVMLLSSRFSLMNAVGWNKAGSGCPTVG